MATPNNEWETRRVVRGDLMTLEDRVDPTRTVQQYHFIESLLTNFKNGETYSASIEKMEQHISTVATSAHEQGYLEGVGKCLEVVPHGLNDKKIPIEGLSYAGGYHDALSDTRTAITNLTNKER